MTDDEPALAALVGEAYGLDAVELELIRKGFNDHYRVRCASGEHILRLYVEGKYYAPDEEHFRFELGLLEHLKADGVPVAAPLRRTDGDVIGRIEGRLASLFEVAPGEQMRGREWDLATATAFGEATSRLHASAAGYRSALPRYTLDLTYLRDEPVQLIGKLLARTGRPKLEDPLGLLRSFDAVDDLGRELPAFGIIHADLHGGNIHVDDEGRVTVFDFDHCAYGWRAYDLATVRMGTDSAIWESFLGGYRAHREPSDAELAAIPLFMRLRQIWDEGDVLAMMPVWGRDVPADQEALHADRLLSALTTM